MNRLIICIFVLIPVVNASKAIGKGLDSLTPSEPASDAAAEPTSEAEAEKSPQANTVVEQDSIDSPLSESDTAQPIVPSVISKHLSNRLRLATSIGHTSIKNDDADWQGGGFGDITITYLPNWKWKTIRPNLSFRYDPQGVTAQSGHTTYQGVVEGYHVGSSVVFPIREGLSAFSSLELGYLLVSLKKLNEPLQDKQLDQNGLQFTIGGGLYWQALENVVVGPRLAVGAGRFQSLQVAGAVGFSF